MIFKKENDSNLVGLEQHIQSHQQSLYNYLNTIWSLTDTDYECYGLCYRNKTEKGYVPELYKGKREYVPVLLEDGLKLLSFYGLNGNIEVKGKQETATVHCVLFANLAKIKPDLLTRGDLLTRREVYEFVKTGRFGMVLQSEKVGIEHVLSEYPGTAYDDLVTKADMHPWHSFRFDFKITYNPMGSV